jgi:hypothetical protein
MRFGGTSMPSAVDDYPIVRFAADGYRLIPSRFPPVSVYRDLVAPDQVETLVEVENNTNPRLRLQDRLMARREGPKFDSAMLQNWNLAPFTYENPEGTTFFAPERSCLELADTPQTALAVSIARRSRFLSRTNEAATGMRMLKTPVEGKFIDLRTVSAQRTRRSRLRLRNLERVSLTQASSQPGGLRAVRRHPRQRVFVDDGPSCRCTARRLPLASASASKRSIASERGDGRSSG